MRWRRPWSPRLTSCSGRPPGVGAPTPPGRRRETPQRHSTCTSTRRSLVYSPCSQAVWLHSPTDQLNSLPLSFALSHTRTRTNARTHTRTHTYSSLLAVGSATVPAPMAHLLLKDPHGTLLAAYAALRRLPYSPPPLPQVRTGSVPCQSRGSPAMGNFRVSGNNTIKFWYRFASTSQQP